MVVVVVDSLGAGGEVGGEVCLYYSKTATLRTGFPADTSIDLGDGRVVRKLRLQTNDTIIRSGRRGRWLCLY